MRIMFAVLFAIIVAVTPLTVVAKGVRVCRIIHGHRICFIVTGGSGITPPIFRR